MKTKFKKIYEQTEPKCTVCENLLSFQLRNEKQPGAANQKHLIK